MTVTLPVDVIEALRARHPDLGWAIVELAQPLLRNRARPAQTSSGRSAPPVELVRLPDHQALIAVNRSLLRHLPSSITTTPLADGRVLIDFRGTQGLADLELALLDQMALPGLDPEIRAALMKLREMLRTLRLDQKLRLSTRSILVVEGISEGSEDCRLGLVFNGAPTRPRPHAYQTPARRTHA